jgi:dTDP-4-amino-4,6-dideoxygalactose transaminase
MVDLGPQHRRVAEAIAADVSRLIASGQLILGEELAAFEREFAAYCGADHCVGVGSGTDAIRLALEALGVGPGDEVVTVAHTFVATVEAIAGTGARPVLIDVDPDTRCMDPSLLAQVLTPTTRAVVPVHLYGRPAPMPAIVELCSEAGVAVVEDSAQAHGATLDGARTGSLGTAGAFSFYPSKNLGALGDAGAVVTADGELAAQVRSLRHHGSVPGDANRHLRPGTTSRLDEIQAAALRHKLRLLDDFNQQRRDVAERYRERLEGLPLGLPAPDATGARQVFHLFVVELDERDRVRAELHDRGIGAGVHYPTPVHLQPAWAQLGRGPGDLPVSERLAARSLSLPIFPGMTPAQVDRVADVLARCLET